MQNSFSAPDGIRLSPESKDNGKETRKAHEARRLQEGWQEGLLMKRRNLFGLLAASAAIPFAKIAPATAEPVVDIHRDTVDGVPAFALYRLEYAGTPAKLEPIGVKT